MRVLLSAWTRNIKRDHQVSPAFMEASPETPIRAHRVDDAVAGLPVRLSMGPQASELAGHFLSTFLIEAPRCAVEEEGQ